MGWYLCFIIHSFLSFPFQLPPLPAGTAASTSHEYNRHPPSQYTQQGNKESIPVYSGVYTPTLQQIIPIVKNDCIDTLYDIIPTVKNDYKDTSNTEVY